jgi:hypothetical protein
MVRAYYPNEIGDAKHFSNFVNGNYQMPANRIPGYQD